MVFDPIAYINERRWRESRPGLERVRELLDRLGRPQDGLRFVQVVGTNGKGSACAYLDAVLREAGHRTGLFTSPSVEMFEERIRVDGKSIALSELAEVTLLVRNAADAMGDHPTEFELLCAAAMLHFARCSCDIAVLEAGLGGRCDATNVVESAEVCVITRIGLDHTDVLGDSIGMIAREKAGIVKEGATVVSWPQAPEARAALEEACARREAPLRVADFSELDAEPLALLHPGEAEGGCTCEPKRRFRYRGAEYETSLLATYQPRNAALAIDAAVALRERGWNIAPSAVRAGVAAARWPGRFEIVGTSPLVIVDGGHNPQGARALSETLREVLPETRPVFVVGVLADKDYRSMLEAVAPLARAFVTVEPDSPRALPGKELARVARATLDGSESAAATGALRASRRQEDAAPVRAEVLEADGMAEAMATARGIAGPRGAVCTFGSLYCVRAARRAAQNAIDHDRERRR